MAASTSYVNFPTGSLWSYSTDGGSSYTALGVLNGDTEATWNYDRNEHEFHDGQKKLSYRNQSMAVSMTLADLNPQALADLSGGMLTKSDTAGSDFSTAPDQVIAAGWTNMKPINLAPTTAAGVAVVMDDFPTLTSVDGDTHTGLAAGDDYYIIEDPSSFSGYSIVLDTAGSGELVTTEAVTIDYDSVSPLASTTLSAGTASYVPSTIALKGYAEDQGITIVVKAVNVDSGGYNFGFKGTASDGTEEMALTFTGYLDSSATDGEQLFTVTETL